MKLIFERIRYQNLMSVGQKPVDISLNTVKKTLITGKNGGGKSTLLEALCFGLFGTPFRKIKKGQLVNSRNKKKCLVEIWFSYGKDSFYVKRGIKPNVFTVTQNDVEWEESSTLTDFQAKLEEQLKISATAFKQVVVLGTAGYVPFMELTTANRRKLVEELLEVAVLGIMSDLNKSEIKSLTQEMNLIENKIEYLRRDIDSHQIYIDKQKATEESHIDDIQKELNEHLTHIRNYRSESSTVEIELAELTAGYDDSLSALLHKYAGASSRLDDALTSKTDMLVSFKSGTCPTCNQAFRDESKIHDTECGITELKDKIEKLKILREETLKKKVESDALEIKIHELDGKLREIKSKMSVHIVSAKSLKAKLDEINSTVDIDYSKIDELKKEMGVLKKEKTEIFDQKYTRTIAADLLKDSGIKASVVKRYIPVFNKKINHYLKIMNADYTFTIDEEFNEVIKSQGREDFSYESFSQGERARIDLSLLFTWRDISSLVSGLEINLLILDEIGDGAADAEGVKSVFKIIDSMNSNVFIISHREEHDKESYGRWLQMVKKGRFSVMEEGLCSAI